jgi:hypothetical protein
MRLAVRRPAAGQWVQKKDTSEQEEDSADDGENIPRADAGDYEEDRRPDEKPPPRQMAAALAVFAAHNAGLALQLALERALHLALQLVDQ